MMPKGVEHRGEAAVLNAFRHRQQGPGYLLCSIQYPGFTSLTQTRFKPNRALPLMGRTRLHKLPPERPDSQPEDEVEDRDEETEFPLRSLSNGK